MNNININQFSQTPISMGIEYFPPSKDKSEETFWALKDRFWMQMIDGKYHEYGPMVFDQGLHNKRYKEPGFFQSLKNGCEFASRYLTERLTIQFYKDLHKVLCAHFKGKENHTEMTSDETGIFRSVKTQCGFSRMNFNSEAEEHYLIVELYERNESYFKEIEDEEWGDILENYFIALHISHINKETLNKWKKEKNIGKKICDAYLNSKKWVENWHLHWEQVVTHINCYLAEVCRSLEIEKFMLIYTRGDKIAISYQCISPQEHERLVQIFFDRYNQKIDEINLKLKDAHTETQIKQLLEEKVEVIADLFQMLEWLHPFPDGQGRTDLVLQAKLLSEEGLNPAILEEPYTSTWSTFDEWKDYLLKGIECWKEEQ